MRFQMVRNANRNPIYFSADKKKQPASEPGLSLKAGPRTRQPSGSSFSSLCPFLSRFPSRRPPSMFARVSVYLKLFAREPASLCHGWFTSLYTTIGRSLIPETRFPFRPAASIGHPFLLLHPLGTVSALMSTPT